MKRTLVLFFAVLTVTAVLHAGATRNGEWHMPQGSAAGTSNGDFVTAAAPGLGSVYHYWIEVPPSLARLVVDLYDGDVGRGGGTESVDGRDRDRAGGWTSDAVYELFNPAGTLMATLNCSETTCVDDDWGNLFDSSLLTRTYADDFDPAAYNGNDGSLNWSANWIEAGDDNSAGGGTIRIANEMLRMRPAGSNDSILRQANLNGATSAILTFDYDTDSTEGGDSIQLQVSTNNAAFVTVETFTGAVSGTHTEDITAFVHTNTRIRFIRSAGYNETNETFWVDNVEISYVTAQNIARTAGHWEFRVDMNGGNDINALGIRAHDGNPGAGGTELNVYADSMVSLGINPAPGAAGRSYALYPWITSGCTFTQNDFDRDTQNDGFNDTGSVVYTSPRQVPPITQTFPATTLSVDNAWNRDLITGWTTGQDSTDYGLWLWEPTITTYTNDQGINGNYETTYVGNFAVQTIPPANPTGNPQTDTFRIYLPNDAGNAPAKPYLEQMVRHNRDFSGPSVVTPGVASTFTITLRLVNPTAQAITFNTGSSNVVTANVPGGIVRYVAGGNVISHGALVSAPADGDFGDVVWNPGTGGSTTLAAGQTAIFSYNVRVTPVAGSPTTIPVTAAPGSGFGTRARYVDETGNTTQARATYTLGEICQLSVSRSLATPVLISSFAAESHGGTTRVRWATASEAGTIGFNLYRANGEKVNDSLIPASLKPHGGKYEVVDSGNFDPASGYIVEEVTSSGQTRTHGPLVKLDGIDRDLLRGRSEERRSMRASLSSARPDLIQSDAKKEKVSAVMVGVKDTGIVRVSAAALAAAFGENESVITKALAKSALSVSFNGKVLPWTTDQRDLFFFAQKSSSIYSSESVYRVELAAGTTMKVVRWAPAATPQSSVPVSHEIETDAFAATVLPIDPAGDYFFWDFILSGDATYGRKTFTVDVPLVASASGASLEVRLQGAYKDAVHAARITLNGVPLGDTSWSSFDAKTAKLTIPGAVLRDGANDITVEGVLAPGAPFDVFYVDGFTMTYQKYASPVDGWLQVTTQGPLGAGPFRAAPAIFDISNPLRPDIVVGAELTRGIASLKVPSMKTLFFTEDYLAPSSVRSSPAAMLKGSVNADWLIIAPRQMRAAAQSLAQLRSRDGLSTLVVDLEQVYDEFAGGNVTPIAIREFVRSAVRSPKGPRYVVLAGIGTVDYRGIAVSPGNMPTMLTSTPDGIFAADSLFTDFDRNGTPEVAIGRIPVRTAAELSAYVAKLDANARIDSQGSSIVFSADNADGGANFRASSVLAEAPLAARPSKRVYLDDLGAVSRAALMSAWQAGAPLVTWVGHGGLDQISASGVLTAYDSADLHSSGRLPVFVAMTCTINRFENGFVDPLGVTMTREEGAGAVAVWSASGLSQHAEASEIQRTFIRLAAQSPDARLGDLIVKTLASHKGNTGNIYLLLGDPAIRLDLPAEVSTGGSSPSTGRE